MIPLALSVVFLTLYACIPLSQKRTPERLTVRGASFHAVRRGACFR